MAQQQIILLILVTIIVGITIVIAVDTMQETHQEANRDAVRQKLLDAATYAQVYYKKNSKAGGGGKSFANISLRQMNLDSSMVEGNFSLSEKTKNSFKITVVPASGGDQIVGIITNTEIRFE